MTGTTGRSPAWSRRQFLGASGAAGALVYVGAGAGVAHADLLPGAPLEDARERVVKVVVETELAAAGVDPSGAAQTTAAVAAGFPSLDPSTQQAIDVALDAIEAAPSEGSFSQLDNDQRQAFMRQALAAGQPPEPPDTAFIEENQTLYSQYLAEADAGTLGEDAGTIPARIPTRTISEACRWRASLRPRLRSQLRSNCD